MKNYNPIINEESLRAIIPVVVTLHLKIEDLGLRGSGRRDKVGFEQLEDAITDLAKLSFDLATVFLAEGDPVLVATALLLLFTGGDDAP